MASRSWNRVELIGNLTRDPELRFTPNGAAVCTFGVATNRTYVSEGERKEEVDFHKLVAWNKLAELCNQLLKKGHRVFISGRLQTRSWEGQDGIQRQTTEIVIEDMILLTPKGNGEVVAQREEVALGELPAAPAASTTSTPQTKSSPKTDEEESSSAEASKEKKEEKEEGKKSTKAEEPPSENVSPDEDLPF
ncbi:single-stranded DNA-binding protein [Candidatus Microgenomates bacterium]|nr:single-stranded DNA-binding protein [Candidatus Microgenomates bacterium]